MGSNTSDSILLQITNISYQTYSNKIQIMKYEDMFLLSNLVASV